MTSACFEGGADSDDSATVRGPCAAAGATASRTASNGRLSRKGMRGLLGVAGNLYDPAERDAKRSVAGAGLNGKGLPALDASEVPARGAKRSGRFSRGA